MFSWFKQIGGAVILALVVPTGSALAQTIPSITPPPEAPAALEHQQLPSWKTPPARSVTVAPPSDAADSGGISRVAEPVVPSTNAPTTEIISAPVSSTPEAGAVGVPAANLPHDLSPIGMFMQADIVVKTVMVGLLLASLFTWIIWIAKSLELFFARSKVRVALQRVMVSANLAEALERVNGEYSISSLLVRAAAGEMQASLAAVDGAGNVGLKERVASVLQRIEVKAGRRMSAGTGVLATIGSIGPFVGLFGTVWGIMNSFIGISQAQTTNLAVVAPGIAEALLATAVGLVAAIPAVVIYNVFARSIGGYRQMLADVSAAVERLISRDLDFRLAKKNAGRTVLASAAE